MKTRTYDDILAKAAEFTTAQVSGACAALGERVISLEEELSEPDLPPAVRQRIAVQLRALVREMQSMHCPVPVPS